MARVSWGLPSPTVNVAHLLQRAGVEIAIDIDAAERAFDGIDFAVLIAIQLLEMIVSEILSLRAGYSGRGGPRKGVIALRIFEHPIGDKIRSGLHDGLGHNFLMCFPQGTRLLMRRLRLRRY